VGRDISQPSRLALDFTQPFQQWIPGVFAGVKRSGIGVGQPPHSSAGVKEKIELYLCSPSMSLWQVIRRTSTIREQKNACKNLVGKSKG
jgi:hypothetical protein